MDITKKELIEISLNLNKALKKELTDRNISPLLSFIIFKSLLTSHLCSFIEVQRRINSDFNVYEFVQNEMAEMEKLIIIALKEKGDL